MDVKGKSLDGKIALVTGAGSGIGKAIALRYASEGAHVVVNDVNGELARDVAKSIEASGTRSLVLEGDVSNSDVVKAMAKRHFDTFGRLDILVNNAGVAGIPARIVSLTEDEWNRVLRVNLTGVFLCCKYFGKRMIKQEAPKDGVRGKVINVSSARGRKGRATFGAYSASKAGVVSLTQTLAMELGKHRITVNCICPGVIHTPIYGAMSVADLATANDVEPPALTYKPVGAPEDVSGVASFMASTDSDYMTGQCVMVTGGRLIA